MERLSSQQCSSDILSDRLSALHKQQGNHLTWEQVKTLLSETTGLYTAVQLKPEEDIELQTAFQNMMRQQESVKTLYKDINALAAKALALLNHKAGLGWTTRGHSAAAVPIFAIGVGAEHFTGWHDNSEIAPLIYQAVLH